ncbi:hypothetical protein F4804DRAFT_305384 [Jackrogersella minutella]|nr:hypothetical protein F4804DRAFT_305384 [Jackrogersella minutella]
MKCRLAGVGSWSGFFVILFFRRISRVLSRLIWCSFCCCGSNHHNIYGSSVVNIWYSIDLLIDPIHVWKDII